MRGKPALSEASALRAYLKVRIEDGSGRLFTGQKGPLQRWTLTRMFRSFCNQVSQSRVRRGLQPIASNAILTSNGDLISTQGDAVNPNPKQPSEVVEFTDAGNFVAQLSVDPTTGSAFGIAMRQLEDGFVFATVDDTTAVLDIWVVK
jgi:hypothetical protein